MRICMIGKFPPIEGGVSMHQYWYAHALASLGHQIHVVTNAREVEARFRMFMRREDWLRCEGEYAGGGYVRVHWTDRFDEKQRHIPWHNPFATKLASLAAQVVKENNLQLIFSYYLEPYGVAGHLSAQMTERPHVVKHAGSDAGRLRLHPQFGPLYDHILRSAVRVITGGSVAEELRAAGVDESNIFRRDDFRIPTSLFRPEGAALDLDQLLLELAGDPDAAAAVTGSYPPSGPFLGVYGKLGEAKGTFELLRSLKLLNQRGQKVHLLVVGHGWGKSEARFHDATAELGVRDCVTQLPFLPHWRIPEFIRLCAAVCFLEHDFPITFHTPTIPREVLACGRCLLGSAEVLSRQILSDRLIHGFNCLAVRDVRNTGELSSKIAAILEDPERAQQIGRRGYRYSVETEAMRIFPRNYESLFAEVLEQPGRAHDAAPVGKNRITDEFAWTRMVVESLPQPQREQVDGFASQYGTAAAWAMAAYMRLLELVERGDMESGVFIEALRLELRLAGILPQNDQARLADKAESRLFRLDAEDRAVTDQEISTLYPVGVAGLSVEEYQYDIRELLAARKAGEFPLQAPRRCSFAAVLPGGRGGRCLILPLPALAVQILVRCDGTRTVKELAAELSDDFEVSDLCDQVANLVVEYFRLGLLKLIRSPGLRSARTG